LFHAKQVQYPVCSYVHFLYSGSFQAAAGQRRIGIADGIPMLTIEQIDDLHARLGSARTFVEYVLALKALGVARYDSYLADGHSEYFGRGGQRVVSRPVHEELPVAETGQRETFLEHLRRHEQRQTTYLEMSRGLAESGIEKWTVDTSRMTITFYDKAGGEMLVEQIKSRIEKSELE
jgi:uncharacterized protein YbcV (DUF1398 family)